MSRTSDAKGLADLLVEAGQRHHQAFIKTDGADPEWPLWYAEAHAIHRPDEPWPPFYANYILGFGPAGMATEHSPA